MTGSHKTALHTRDLAIGYEALRRPPVTVAEGIDLRLYAGEVVCLLGPNGVGKTTLMRTLAGMLPPLRGQVLLLGEDLARLEAHERAQRLSVVLTERPGAGLLTGYELVALGRHPYTDWMGRLSERDRAVVQEAVAAVGAEDIAARPVNELSDGQRQKLMIARALAQEPAVILLDEPTAYLDLLHRVEVMRLLRRLAHELDRAVLLSSHDLDLALRTADRLWLMPHQAPIQTGAPEDLILSGAFQQVFHSDQVHFDIDSGAFRMAEGQAGRIALSGEGPAAFWTRRALERAGWVVETAAGEPASVPARLHVTVTDGEDSAHWVVTGGGQRATFRRIYDLVGNLDEYREKGRIRLPR